MFLKKKELGVLSVDAGDVICFSMDSVLKLMKRLNGDCGNFGDDVDNFIEEVGGVPCDFRCDGGYSVDKMTAVMNNGSTCSVAVLGMPDNFKRFLRDDEIEFNEFVDNHPNYKDVGKGEDFDADKFQKIVDEYSDSLVG